jgi:hypothetical protein
MMSSEPRHARKEVKVTDETEVTVRSESELEYKADSDSSLMTAEEEDLSAKARAAGLALEDLITSAIDKAKIVTKQKAKEFARAAEGGPGGMSAAKDAQDISRLGPLVEGLARAFEDTMTDIRKQSYEEQEKLLIGYRKLLEEQINVINSRMHFAKRVK